ncbi:predicted protein [Histoplasma mississippiense (nom. inval.)]|uniref:predicted protein n=1 Tax=Ajellomyces capsulatus (strain NAm1 / WU24) TaxID=2059318 RepID=UPI000157CAE6|nr:predicted protein [Histoplasma mississippiense (nom. inval.)]EDN09335.1 predicted protein [Histoplasma mississippiense (nom. inval.)]
MHQHLALAAFRPVLNDITPSNCNAVFAFSSLIAALAFAFSRFVGRPGGGEPVAELLQDFLLFRGVESVLSTSWELIQKGELGPMIRRPAINVSQPISKDVINALDYLHDCNGDHVTQLSAEEKDANNHAIRELRISFERPASSWENVFRWPILLPEAYLAHLKARKPMALVILAHYCVVLSRLDSCWWSQGWATHLFEAIYRSLGTSWRPLLRWPMQMVGHLTYPKRVRRHEQRTTLPTYYGCTVTGYFQALGLTRSLGRGKLPTPFELHCMESNRNSRLKY